MNCLGSFDLISKDKWMSELINRSSSYSIEWKNKYQHVKVTDLVVRGTLGIGAFGRVELVTIPNAPDESFAMKKIKKTRAVELECEKYFLSEKKIMQYCNSPFICKYVYDAIIALSIILFFANYCIKNLTLMLPQIENFCKKRFLLDLYGILALVEKFASQIM